MFHFSFFVFREAASSALQLGMSKTTRQQTNAHPFFHNSHGLVICTPPRFGGMKLYNLVEP